VENGFLRKLIGFEKADWGKFQEESNKLFRKINDELSVDRQSN